MPKLSKALTFICSDLFADVELFLNYEWKNQNFYLKKKPLDNYYNLELTLFYFIIFLQPLELTFIFF